MNWFLYIGIFLIAAPSLGFIVIGTIMLYAALKDDDDGARVVLGVTASAVLGAVFLVVYFASQRIS